jgi:hypothetical protein
MSIFWASILLGAVFGFLGSTVANLIHNPLLVLIDRWRLSTKNEAICPRSGVSPVPSRSENRKIRQVHISGPDLRNDGDGFLGAVISGVGGFLLSYLSDRLDAMVLRFALGLFSGGLFSFYMLAAARYQAVAWGLNNFEKLDAEFKQKWAGPLNEDKST